MHDLLSFVPRPRTKSPSDSIKRTVSALVNDIQVLAQYDRSCVLKVLAKVAHMQRVRLRAEERHGYLRSR